LQAIWPFDFASASGCPAASSRSVNCPARSVIHVRRGWDPKAGEIATKSGKARRVRRVRIANVLGDYLDEHLLMLDWQQGRVFGVTATDPYMVTPLTCRAEKAWKAAKLDGSHCTSAATPARRR
jgi:hypothetical protein